MNSVSHCFDEKKWERNVLYRRCHNVNHTDIQTYIWNMKHTKLFTVQTQIRRDMQIHITKWSTKSNRHHLYCYRNIILICLEYIKHSKWLALNTDLYVTDVLYLLLQSTSEYISSGWCSSPQSSIHAHMIIIFVAKQLTNIAH